MSARNTLSSIARISLPYSWNAARRNIGMRRKRNGRRADA
jgi:hypothetical protein